MHCEISDRYFKFSFGSNASEYGRSFVAKISRKKKFFFEKKFFLQNIHYLQKKIILYGKKIYIDFFLLKKLFLQKIKKYIYLI